MILERHSHTYPVDPSLTPEEAWKELCIFSRRVSWTGVETWAVIECDGEECNNIDRSNCLHFHNDQEQ